jgi:hypothetical protein
VIIDADQDPEHGPLGPQPPVFTVVAADIFPESEKVGIYPR